MLLRGLPAGRELNMKKIFIALSLFIIVHLAGFQGAHATPVQLAFIDPIQLIHQRESINGMRVNLAYGVNYDVTGIDIGVINQVDRNFKGLQVGFFNNNLKTTGLQIGFINKTNFLEGIQIGILNFHTQGMTDFFPFINWAF